MSTIIKQIFTYNKSQRRGILVLCLILATLIAIRIFYPFKTITGNQDFTQFQQAVIDFERSTDSLESERVRIRDEERTRARDSTYARYFTDNKHHRTSFKNFGKPPGKSTYIADTLKIELNGADSLDLLMLRGIGPYYADKILKYRNKLGGFYKKEQLLEVYGMDTIRYYGLKNNIYIDTSLIRKIDINTIEFKALAKHPYFEYHVVKAIIYRRDKKGLYGSIEELKELDVIYPELFEKIRPYILVSSQQSAVSSQQSADIK